MSSVRGELVSIKVNGVDLVGFHSLSGQQTKKIFVMSHGRGSNFHSGFGSFFPHLVNAAHAVGFDFLGVSDSAAGFYRLYDVFESCVDDYSGWICFCQEKGYKEVVLGAHSYGPIKTTYFYNQVKPQSIKGLFNLAPTDTYGIWKNHVGENADKFLELAKRLMGEGNGKDLMPKEAYYNPISAKSYLALYGKESKIHVYDFQDSNFEYLILKDINIPILTIVGSEDKNPLDAAPDVKLKILDSVLKQPTTVMIEGADHVFLNKGEALEEPLKAWLERI